MWKKISIQLILFSLALFVIFFAYKVYINPKNNIETENVELTKPKNNEKIDFIESKNDEKKANALDDVEEIFETSILNDKIVHRLEGSKKTWQDLSVIRKKTEKI